LHSSHESGLNRVARRTWYAPHATAILFAPFGSSDFYLFPTVKEKLERTQVADEDQFFESRQAFWGVSIRMNWIGYFRLGHNEFKK
jgi:hypothetical protein